MRAASIAFVVVMIGACASVGLADTVLYDFTSGGQGWGSYGAPTTDSGVLPGGSVGQGRYHAFDWALGSWGIVDVSPATDLTAYTGLTVDARLVANPTYPDDAPRAVDLGLVIGGNEYYAPAVTLTSSYQTFAITFADFVPNGSDLSAAIIQFRILRNGYPTGLGRFDYDQVTGVPEPATLLMLCLLPLIRRR
jgi:hypothetical protein